MLRKVYIYIYVCVCVQSSLYLYEIINLSLVGKIEIFSLCLSYRNFPILTVIDLAYSVDRTY